MTDHVYKSVELTGSSSTTVEDAVRNAIRRASKTLHNLRWFEVTSVRGGIEDGDLALHSVHGCEHERNLSRDGCIVDRVSRSEVV